WLVVIRLSRSVCERLIDLSAGHADPGIAAPVPGAADIVGRLQPMRGRARRAEAMQQPLLSLTANYAAHSTCRRLAAGSVAGCKAIARSPSRVVVKDPEQTRRSALARLIPTLAGE